MKKPRTIRLVALILILLVLLPLLVFTVYEVSGSSASESFVTDVYRRQLDVVLFSINQFAWDVVNSWASTVENAWIPSDGGGTFPRAFAGEFLGRNPAVDAVFLADSTGKKISFVAGNAGDGAARRASLASRLASNEPLVNRLLILSRKNYRKIEPLMVRDSSGRANGVVLLFVLRDLRGRPALAGIRLRPDRFVEEVLAERMREASGAEFIITVTRTSNGERVFASGEVPGGESELRRQLWLFPDLEAGIRLRGETIQQLARSRVSRDVKILLILDVVLLVGAWVVYRSVKREMELVRLKSDFVSNVSHELRTPLALIRMYAETLEMGRLKGEEKRREYYETIVKEAERLTRLVNNLLNFSRMEAGRRPYDLSPQDLNALVVGVLDSFSPHLKNEGLTPVVDLDPGIPAVRADREAIQEALINLLDNAVKYGGKAKYLRVSTGVRLDDVFVDVEDHGPGIPPEYRERVFETFFRVPATRNAGQPGSGLGLSIARHIMEAHGGKITLKSTPGKGSTFTLAFRYEHDTRH
ncbi:MAG TPA: HAMP domain-containing sensor histidine kinase [Bacteroidota bacterium]|nr:HAMP domain-containing sensor histidine kinase [Bacteroidota bacterium]